MSNLEKFWKYAAAFEHARDSDDWSVLAPFFAEEACYTAEWPAPLGGRCEGRAAILDYFKRILDGFDRRFATIAFLPAEPPVPPREAGDTLTFHGRARYTSPGRPDLCFDAESSVTFDGDVIVDLADRFDASARETIAAYLHEHAAALGIGLSRGKE
jgi:hypothetical protein